MLKWSATRVALMLVGCSALIGGSACASDLANNRAFNPEGLPTTDLAQVQSICQTQMGLSPKEPLSTVWGGAVSPGLVGGENHFQGCVASLSNSVKLMAQDRFMIGSNENCQNQGFKPGTPQLAQCILKGERSHAASGQTLALENVNLPAPALRGSFFTASGKEIHRREEFACAALGLAPGSGGFASCVKTMDDTFFAIDNPEN